MLKKLFIFAVLLIATKSYSQNLEGYFRDQGVAHLSQAAHTSNDFYSGEYDVQDSYVEVDIVSRDNLFNRYVKTNMKVYRGTGDLYFSDIYVTLDEDNTFPTFEAFGINASLVVELIKAIDQDTYNKIKNDIINIFHTDISRWTGKMWALFAINLDYYSYLLSK
jgi:Tfp pilus assembly protein PilE